MLVFTVNTLMLVTCSATDIPIGSCFTMCLNIFAYMYTVFAQLCVCVLCCVHVYTCVFDSVAMRVRKHECIVFAYIFIDLHISATTTSNRRYATSQQHWWWHRDPDWSSEDWDCTGWSVKRTYKCHCQRHWQMLHSDRYTMQCYMYMGKLVMGVKCILSLSIHFIFKSTSYICFLFHYAAIILKVQ